MSVSPSASPSEPPEKEIIPFGTYTIPEKKKLNIYIKLRNNCYLNLNTQEVVVALSKGKSFIPFESKLNDNYDIDIKNILLQTKDNETAIKLGEQL